jgi:ABC-type multidrug transport system permease subunit
MFNYETLWDVYEMKFVIFFLSAVAAIALTTYLYDKNKKKEKNKDV